MTAPLVTIQNTIISRLENITLANSYAFDIGTVAFDDRDRNDNRHRYAFAGAIGHSDTCAN